VGYLDELKQQAAETRARNTLDIGALERNTLVTDSACQSAFRYLTSLAQQLNIIQPMSKAVFRFDRRTSFSGLKLGHFRADSRLKKLRDADVFEFVSLRFDMKTGTRLTLAKDFPPEIEKLEARLRQCGATYQSEVVRDQGNGRFIERRFDLLADFHGTVRILPDHDRGWVTFQIVNLEGFETVSVRYPAFEVGSARLDDLARWIVGEPNAFLRGGHELRRVEV